MMLPLPRDLKKWRLQLGLTQKELAEKAGVSQPLIARIESGDIDPKLSTYYRIVRALMEFESERLHAKDIMSSPVIHLKPDDPVEKAAKLMEEHEISQLPIIESSRCIGSITENRLVQLMLSEDIKKISAKKVIEYAEEPFPTVSKNEKIESVASLLEFNPAVLVTEGDRIIGIITKHDVIKLLKAGVKR
ncbi:MAG: hypothetical protein PWR13_56 [Archaeoglobi archaeon]|nr:CBS domain-containing protein [Candidatus Mnemosynella bozhongmuii]MDI3502707.1 hypothetical protein [Archaeoglobi archaeon]MDK2781028.1 hypothetical protein [Archaeoglobi archaeon]